jgi:hypothetical protein
MMRVRNWLVAEGNMYMLAGGCFFMVAMGSIFERYVSVLHVIAIVMMFVVSCFFFALSFRPNWDVVRPNRPFQGKWCVLGLVLIVVPTVFAMLFPLSFHWITVVVVWFLCMMATGIGAMIVVSSLRSVRFIQRRRNHG